VLGVLDQLLLTLLAFRILAYHSGQRHVDFMLASNLDWKTTTGSVEPTRWVELVGRYGASSVLVNGRNAAAIER
jgi:hypothetical protein